MIDTAPLFARDGPLARALPGWEPRPQQARMAAAVAATLDAGGHLIVEAGTGVGKSIAYLAPAILWATRTGVRADEDRRVVVSTHTRALQEQLARKDLPLLERALAPAGIAFRFALLMGSENYLCVQRLQQEMQQRSLGSGAVDGDLEALARHAGTATSGLRSEIPFAVPDLLWARLRRDRDICLGPGGLFWEACLYRRDLVRARETHVLVVNHALYFLDLATGGRILPPHGAVILDEAHRAEEAALGQFGLSITERTVARLIEDADPAPTRGRGRTRRGRAGRLPGDSGVAAAAARARSAAEAFFEDVRREALAIAAQRGRGERERSAGAAPSSGRGTAAPIRIRSAGLVEDRLRRPLEELEAELRDAARDPAEAAAAQMSAALAGRARDLRVRLDAFLAQRLPDAVYWVEAPAGRRAATALHAVPVDVAPILRPKLFEGGRSVILTSATLAASGSFAHLRRRLGITAADETALGSPYDFRRQALLYLAPTVPDPSSAPEEFAAAVIRECRELLRASDGGAFVLFTSYGLLRRTADALEGDGALRGLRFFRQEPGGTPSILEEFRATRRGALFGTMTFWQGVDVPGDALRSVIITRLPFEVPDDPLAEARGELIRGRGGDPFEEESLPSAILTFRQGFGRLIRTRDDRGCVAVLDPRLRTRAYGTAFLESLPSCRTTESIDEVRRFFAPHPDSGT